MLIDIIDVKHLSGTTLFLRFEDGKEGAIDISTVVKFTGVFEPLKGRKFLESVKVNSELGTICWPNEADLCPDILYAKVTSQPLPDFGSKKKTG